jgi:beta-galactosidase
LTIRSGMKDDTNALLPMRQPGMLAEIAGVEVEDCYALQDAVPVVGGGFKGESHIWAERLKVRDAEKTRIIARYGASNGWLDEQAAVTSHPFGKGWVTYVGAYLDDAAQQKLLDDIVQAADVQTLMQLPAGVEACQRVGADGRQIFILINHERTEKQVILPWQAHEHLHGHATLEFQLEPYGIAVITRVE